jgi:hypothetical protein
MEILKILRKIRLALRDCAFHPTPPPHMAEYRWDAFEPDNKTDKWRLYCYHCHRYILITDDEMWGE